MEEKKILLVDDESAQREALKGIIEQKGVDEQPCDDTAADPVASLFFSYKGRQYENTPENRERCGMVVLKNGKVVRRDRCIYTLRDDEKDPRFAKAQDGTEYRRIVKERRGVSHGCTLIRATPKKLSKKARWKAERRNGAAR